MEAAGSSAQPPHGGRAATRVAIVGGSVRAAAIARLLQQTPGTSVVSICARSDQPAGFFAREAGILLVADPLMTLSHSPAPDIVLDLSEDVVTRTALESGLSPGTELVGGATADIISEILEGDRPVARLVHGHAEDAVLADGAGFDRRILGGRAPEGATAGDVDRAGLIRRLEASNDALNKANRDLETRLAEVYFMHEFVKSLVAYHRTEDISSVVVDACVGILGADVCAIYLLDRATWSLHLERSQGRPVGTLPAVVSLSDGLLGRAYSQGLALEEDAASLPPGSMWLTSGSKGPQTLAAAALSAAGEPIGVLGLGWSLERHLGEAEIERFRVMADQSALALQNALLHSQLEQLSVTDRLTELFNHGYLKTRLDQELGRAARFGHTLSVIMLDIDDFKALNDRFGHLVGDEVLRGVSALIRENLREMDVAARYGGEEFVVLVPETDTVGARAVAERIRQSIAAQTFVRTDAGAEVRATVSMGVSTFPADGRSVESLIRAADDAMYGAKRAGKDRVVTARSMQA
jgi:diguanylate cyclase (GGDEF)-like protein